MSEYDLSNNLLSAGLLISSILLFGVSLFGFWLYRANLSTRRDLDTLAAQLDVFTETSILVARSVDTLSRSGQTLDRVVSSRRWLIDEARKRLSEGGELEQIGQCLGLNEDEISLLHRVCLQQQVIAG